MSNILLVEPDYRSKFPPLGLLRIASYHKECGDAVTFVRGKVPHIRDVSWHKVYISSLFTYELPRTVDTIKYYEKSVVNPSQIIVGGIGATLFPDYIKEQVNCTVIEGALDTPNKLGEGIPSIEQYVPDYSLIDTVSWKYSPQDAYFCRITKGCIRKCGFCAVPKLEPNFGYFCSVTKQVEEVKSKFGERQNLVLLDNNVLAIDNLEEIIKEISFLGFQRGAKLNNRKRTVDFNQGIDARLINDRIAGLLSEICLSPIRLAFDYDGIEKPYRKAINELAKVGFTEFTNYVMFNYEDTPQSFYNRMRINVELSEDLGIRVTGFPMKYVPIDDITRRHISQNWNWRFLRGIQCVLSATRGLVSPNLQFFKAAFGSSYDEFVHILSMPDRYIIHRMKNTGLANEWRELFDILNQDERDELYRILQHLNTLRNRKEYIARVSDKYKPILEHYFPNGEAPHDDPNKLE